MLKKCGDAKLQLLELVETIASSLVMQYSVYPPPPHCQLIG